MVFNFTGDFFCWNLFFVDHVPSANSAKIKPCKTKVLYGIIRFVSGKQIPSSPGQEQTWIIK